MARLANEGQRQAMAEGLLETLHDGIAHSSQLFDHAHELVTQHLRPNLQKKPL